MFDKKLHKFKEYLIESENYQLIPEASGLDKENETKARIIVNRAIVWINVKRGFFGKLLANLNIYGSSELDPKTMCTNGLNITYHPEFVLNQSKGAVNFVICHEILHCLADHMGRRGSRDPQLWNYACDYAINPILDAEVGKDFDWPKNPDGSRMGLYEEKYAGMRAEDIYDKLIEDQKSGKSNLPDPSEWDFGDVADSSQKLPSPDSADSIVQDVRGEEEGGIPKPGEEGDGKSGSGKKGEGEGEGEGGASNIIGKKVTVTDGPHAGKTGIVKSVLPNGDITIE